MWIERLAWAATILAVGSLPALWLILKGITWYDDRHGVARLDDWGNPLDNDPGRAGVNYRRF